jgi:hypothetical protein
MTATSFHVQLCCPISGKFKKVADKTEFEFSEMFDFDVDEKQLFDIDDKQTAAIIELRTLARMSVPEKRPPQAPPLSIALSWPILQFSDSDLADDSPSGDATFAVQYQASILNFILIFSMNFSTPRLEYM